MRLRPTRPYARRRVWPRVLLVLVALTVSAYGLLLAFTSWQCDVCTSRTPEWESYGLFFGGAAVAALTVVVWVAGTIARRWFPPRDDNTP